MNEQGKESMEKEEFQSSSIILNETIFYVNDIVHFMHKDNLYAEKLKKFNNKVLSTKMYLRVFAYVLYIFLTGMFVYCRSLATNQC